LTDSARAELGGDPRKHSPWLIIRVDSEDARLLATAVAVREEPRNLVEVLGQMSQMLREASACAATCVITTAPRVSATCSPAPVLTPVAMYFTSRYYIDTLFSEPLGRLAAVASGVLVLIGLFLNHRIAKVEL
jgi:Flp pilus assembly protein TadB